MTITPTTPLDDMGPFKAYAIPLASMQPNIKRFGSILCGLSKPQKDFIKLSIGGYHMYTATVFHIHYWFPNNILTFSFQMYFMIIKGQSSLLTPVVDFYTYEVISPKLNTDDNFIRTNVDTIHINNTLFKSTSNVKILQFISSFEAYLSPGVGLEDTMFQFNLRSSIINGTHLSITVEISQQIRVSKFKYLIIVINTQAIQNLGNEGFSLFNKQKYIELKANASNYNESDYNQSIYNQSDSYYDISTDFSNIGPKYNNKCFLGFASLKYNNNSKFNYFLNATLPKYDFNMISQSVGEYQDFANFNFICFALARCASNQSYTDFFTKQCYQSTECPLPVQLNYSQSFVCPKCVQLLCENCSQVNRSVCSQCKQNSNSFLKNKRCQCNNHYLPVYYIPLYPWNTQKKSLSACQRNCSYFIQGCNLTNCSSQTFCQQCISDDYYLKLINDTTQNCYKCDVELSNCAKCFNQSICLKCLKGYYLRNQYAMVTVTPPYDPDEPPMPYNQTQVSKSQCIHCSQVIIFCIECFNDTNTTIKCITCQSQKFCLSPDRLSCFKCNQFIPQCIQCISPTYCTVCQFPYKLSANHTCIYECQTGYQLVYGRCTTQGCINDVVQNKNNFSCLACYTSFHYAYNMSSKLCLCDLGYVKTILPSNQKSCISYCGDGYIREDEICDDNNQQDGDGCSSQCKIQDKYKCINQPSHCIIKINFSNFSYNYAVRVLQSNKGIFSFSLEPKFAGLRNIDWINQFKFKVLSQSNLSSIVNDIQYSYSFQTGQILVSMFYLKDLQDNDIQVNLQFDSSKIQSNTSYFNLKFHANGINAPLIIQGELTFKMKIAINIVFNIIMALLLIQFIVGSYVHKMIGLETIQIVQVFYFSRMIVEQNNSSILNTMDTFKASNGYSISQILFGESDIGTVQASDKYSTVSSAFLHVDLEKYFLLNVNISMIPIFLSIFAYLFYFIRKSIAKTDYLINEGKDKDLSTAFTILNRSTKWVYNHFLFPYIIIFSFASYFSSILYMESTVSESSLKMKNSIEETLSFSFQMVLLILTFFICCYQMFNNVFNYGQMNLTQREARMLKMSLIQQLQNDQNNPDRPNYHPLYVLAYLLYYFLLGFSMGSQVLLKEFKLKLQVTIILCLIYFFLIWIWKPYYEAISIHNYFLVMNQGILCTFLIICEIFHRMQKMSQATYISFISVIVILITAIIICGYIRIIIEKKYRSSLESGKQNKQEMNKEQEKKQNLNYTLDTYLFRDKYKNNGIQYQEIKKTKKRKSISQTIDYHLREQYNQAFYEQKEDIVNTIENLIQKNNPRRKESMKSRDEQQTSNLTNQSIDNDYHQQLRKRMKSDWQNYEKARTEYLAQSQAK